MFILQIIHHVPPDPPGGQHKGGDNVIEIKCEKRHQVDREWRLHQKQPHRAPCEAHILEGDFSAEDAPTA